MEHTIPQHQKALKLKVNEFAKQKLEGKLLRDFENFFSFLKEQKFTVKWKGISAFWINHKNKHIGAIAFFGKGGWDDVGLRNCETNCVTISVNFEPEFFNFLNNKDNENYNRIMGIVMERLNSKCINCREGRTGCSKRLGNSINFNGQDYNNICAGALWFDFLNSGDSMDVMYENVPSNNGVVPLQNGAVTNDVIKDMLLAGKEYSLKQCG